METLTLILKLAPKSIVVGAGMVALLWGAITAIMCFARRVYIEILGLKK